MLHTANNRKDLLPYPVIAAAVQGGSEYGDPSLFRLHSGAGNEDEL